MEGRGLGETDLYKTVSGRNGLDAGLPGIGMGMKQIMESTLGWKRKLYVAL